jgi:transposase
LVPVEVVGDDPITNVEDRAVRIADLQGKLAAVVAAMEALERRVLGPKSEKMPPPEQELRNDEPEEDAEARRLAGLQRRRERAALRAKLRGETVIHHLGDDQRACPHCDGIADRPIGDGKQTFLFEYVPGYFVRQVSRPGKGGLYVRPIHRDRGSAAATNRRRPLRRGLPGAHRVMKCADALPLHRLAKQYQRLGIPMSRSTLTDLITTCSTPPPRSSRRCRSAWSSSSRRGRSSRPTRPRS